MEPPEIDDTIYFLTQAVVKPSARTYSVWEQGRRIATYKTRREAETLSRVLREDQQRCTQVVRGLRNGPGARHAERSKR